MIPIKVPFHLRSILLTKALKKWSTPMLNPNKKYIDPINNDADMRDKGRSITILERK